MYIHLWASLKAHMKIWIHHEPVRGDALQEMVRQQSWQSSMCVGTTITACCSPNPTALPSSQLPGHCTTCLYTRLVGITHFVFCSELFLHARASRLGPGKSPLPSGDSGVNTFCHQEDGRRLHERRKRAPGSASERNRLRSEADPGARLRLSCNLRPSS